MYTETLTQYAPLHWLSLKLETRFAGAKERPDPTPAIVTEQGDFANELIQRMENGYVAEETGRFVTVPKFIIRQIEARLKTNDCC